MNDPNGLVFYEGVYHLFFQYHPDSCEWGPMHWGHATSRDLLHWQEHAVALEPDELGMIFSGSVVVDAGNTSGLAPAGQIPLVAIFTHNHESAKAQGLTHQHQSLAYSIDAGCTWRKYAGNPVLESPGLEDFRDPKVFWHQDTLRWVMSVACGDHIAFYASSDLKDWTPLSSFGRTAGAHGGVWECPDLVPFSLAGRERWVLLVSLNPGGPQGGSATQYFVGDFDGRTFTPEHDDIRWLDWGADNYAGVTWSNTPGRCLFIGWMSNWQYASKLPTFPWRGAMTLPRELLLHEVDGKTLLRLPAAAEVAQVFHPQAELERLGGGAHDLSELVRAAQGRFRLRLQSDARTAWRLQLHNDQGQRWTLSYDAEGARFAVDRSQSQSVVFHPEFETQHSAPRLAQTKTCDVVVYADTQSLETIADDGLTAITSLVFPSSPWTTLSAEGNLLISVDAYVERGLEQE